MPGAPLPGAARVNAPTARSFEVAVAGQAVVTQRRHPDGEAELVAVLCGVEVLEVVTGRAEAWRARCRIHLPASRGERLPNGLLDEHGILGIVDVRDRV